MKTRRTIAPALLTSLGAAAVVLAGCSALVNGSDYLVDGGGAGPDGATDGAVDDGGSMDGALDGDGGPDGGPLPNLPPVVGGIGLSTYRPVPGQTLEALLGPLHDPNGDTLTTTLTWLHDGTEIAGATGDALTLDTGMYGVGDEISVRIVVEDPEGLVGEATAGPAIIEADDVTRWRLLTPPRYSARASIGAVDRRNQRLLFWSRLGGDVAPTAAEQDRGLWEMQLSPSERERWVRIYPTGAPPEANDGAVVIYDFTNDRLLHFAGRINESGGTDTLTNDLYELDMSSRGSEVWTQLTVATAPGPRSIASVALSADGTRALIHGGGSDTELIDDLWELDLATTTFTDRGVTTGTPLLGSTLVWDEARNRVIRIGGTSTFDGPPVPVASMGVIDLGDGSFTSVSDFPAPLIGANAAIIGDTAYLVGGLTGSSTSMAANQEIYVIDLTDLTVTSTALSPSPDAVLGAFESRAPFASTWIYGGRGIERGNADFHEIDVAGGSASLLTGAGHDYPERQLQGLARIHPGVDAATFLGGRLGLETGDPMFEQVWEYGSDDVWTEVVVAEDPSPPAGTGARPSPRWGIVFDGSHPFPNPEAFQILGGNGPDLEGGELWRIADSGGPHWESALVTSAVEPSARTGFGLFAGGCGYSAGGVDRGNVVGVFGGEDFSGSLVNDTWMLECELPTSGSSRYRNCTWMDDVVTATSTSPPARRWMASALAGHEEPEWNRLLFMFGGEVAGGAVVDDLYVFDNCSSSTSPTSWIAVSTADPKPAGRFGHSMTHERPPPGTPTTDPATILLFGGIDGSGSYLNDVWRVVPTGPLGATGYGADWEAIAPVAGERPAPRRFHAAAFDHVNRRLLIYGGNREGAVFDDLWELRVR